MTDGLCALLPGNLDQLLRDRRTCHRRTEQVLVLVGCIGLETRKHIVVAEVIRDILDVQLRRTRNLRTLCQTIQLVALSYIDTAADDLITEGLLQPWHDTGRIKTTRISQNDLLTLRIILWYQITHNHFSSINRPRRIKSIPWKHPSFTMPLSYAIKKQIASANLYIYACRIALISVFMHAICILYQS